MYVIIDLQNIEKYTLEFLHSNFINWRVICWIFWVVGAQGFVEGGN